MEEGGGPAGVKDATDEGGGPAGVVEGFGAKLPNEVPLLFPNFAPGVDGGLEEYGTVNEAMLELGRLKLRMGNSHDVGYGRSC
jgi:hypothetical protein